MENIMPNLQNVTNNVISRIVFACDAGMGSSVMGESIMKTKLNKAMLSLDVIHTSVADIGKNVTKNDIIITTKPLEDRVKTMLFEAEKNNQVYAVDNLLNGDAYDEIIKKIK